jgi:hypothetical protein
MKKIIVISLIFAVVFVSILPAVSDARGPGYYGGRGYYNGYRGNGWGIAGAVVGGLALGAVIGNALAAPVYVAPPPPRVYYYPAPPPAYYYQPSPRAYEYPY